MNKLIDLNDIDTNIRHLTNEHPEARPFLCEGSPIGSEVFLVGINPGTDTSFWPCWRPPYGCHKDEWLQDYRRNHSRYKPTRARIERLFESLAPVRCLETNVFCRYSPEEKSLCAEERDTSVFDYLFEVLRPRVMFIHGMSGISHMEQVFKTALPLGQFTTVIHNGCEVDVITGSHLSRGWSFARVDALGCEIREKCMSRKRC